MYLLESYEVTDQNRMMDFMELYNFADLVTYHNKKICSNKVPFLYNRERNVLSGHFGRTNPQLKDIDASGEVLVIFSGPDSYVSPQWYKSEGMVPTWNFQTLQVRGKGRLVGEEELLDILNRLSEFHESAQENKWSIKSLEPDRLKFMLDMITGFEIEVTEIKFKEKMSQNRSVEDQRSVIESLRSQGSYEMNQVAEIMSDNILIK